MMGKSYQRKYLRAPLKETILFSDSEDVYQAKSLNISEGGMLLGELPAFPEVDEISLLISLPQLPMLKNFSLIKMQTFSKELFGAHVIRLKAELVRREELSQNLDNIFRSRFGLQFTKISAQGQKMIEEYVVTFSSNLIYLQMLIDSFNSDDETKVRTWTLASLLGYKDIQKISQLRSSVSHDYKSLQWL